MINKVVEKLNNAINECEVAIDNEPDMNGKLWLKGMQDGFKLAIITMENEGLVPMETGEAEAEDGRAVILKFPGV